MPKLSQFERQLGKEIEKQAKRVRDAEGTKLYEVEARILRALIKAFDQYKILRGKKAAK